MASVTRVIARYLGAAELQDPKRDLAKLKSDFIPLAKLMPGVEPALTILSAIPEADLHWVGTTTDTAKRQAWNLALSCSLVYERKYGTFWRDALPFFRGLLATYQLSGKTLKGVEKASQLYGKAFRPRVEKGNYVQYLQTYQKFVGAIQATLEVAEKAIQEGERAQQAGGDQAPRKLNAGSFTVINSGGFDTETMERVAGLVKAADQALHKHGFGNVCYGDVQVTNQIHRSQALAFYQASTDEIFVRADAKIKEDILRTVLHELGHRLVHKERRIASRMRALYAQCESAQITHRLQERPDHSAVKPGDTLQVKRTRYEAVKVVGDRVQLRKNNDADARYSIPVQDWLEARQRQEGGGSPTGESKEGGFVSSYAKAGGPEENFCEMFSFYCLGKLKPVQLALFEQAIKP